MILTLVYFFAALLILILFHELGHFLVARFCGVKVLRFSFGFGKVLFSRRDRQGTEYAWSLLPFGGYVQMLDEEETDVAAEEKHRAFNRQPLLNRVAIVLAGPVFNFIFAFLALWLGAVIGVQSFAPIIGNVLPESPALSAGLHIEDEIIAVDGREITSWRDFQYAMMPYLGSQSSVRLKVKHLKTGEIRSLSMPLSEWILDSKNPDALKSLGIVPFIPAIPAVVGRVMEATPSDAAGLQAGDRIVSFNGKKLTDWLDLVDHVQKNPGQKLALQVLRGDQTLDFSLTIGEKHQEGHSTGYVGLLSQKFEWPDGWIRYERQNPLDALLTAGKQTVRLTAATFALTGRLITGQLDFKNVSGPVGIAAGAGASGRQGLTAYLSFLAIISISLGVLNLLPVPMLDGGHLVFYLLEWLRGRPLSQNTRALAFYAGLFLLLVVTVFALGNDISRLT